MRANCVARSSVEIIESKSSRRSAVRSSDWLGVSAHSFDETKIGDICYRWAGRRVRYNPRWNRVKTEGSDYARTPMISAPCIQNISGSFRVRSRIPCHRIDVHASVKWAANLCRARVRPEVTVLHSRRVVAGHINSLFVVPVGMREQLAHADLERRLSCCEARTRYEHQRYGIDALHTPNEKEISESPLRARPNRNERV